MTGETHNTATEHAGAVIDRLRQALGCATDADLCRALDLSTGTVSNWRKRGTLPLSQCVSAATDGAVSLDWLVFGRGPTTREDPAPYIVESRPGPPVAGPTDADRLAIWQQATADVLGALAAAGAHWPPETVTGLIAFVADHHLDTEAVDTLVRLFADRDMATAKIDKQRVATES